MIPQTNVDFLWNTVVKPRLGCAYAWGGSFDPNNPSVGTDCSGAVSAELCALVYGPSMPWQRQFWTGTFAGATPGQTGPFGGVPCTTNLVCIASPDDAPADAAMVIAVRQMPDPTDAHMIARVQGIDLEMGGPPNNFHEGVTDIHNSEFNQYFYLPGPIEGGAPPVTIFGPDLSNNNWSSMGEIPGWLDDCFHTEGYSFMIHKVSEGNYFSDAYWPTVRDWCHANNVPVIGYHYVTGDDPASQARRFTSNGGGSNAMLDFEQNSGNIANYWNVVNAFNAAGVNISLSYIPHWYWQNIGSPDLSQVPGLIASSYYERGKYGYTEYMDAGGDSGPGWAAYGGCSPVIWQFSDGALIGGKSVDANAFKGSVSDIAALFDPSSAPSGPTNTPTGGIPVADATSIQADVSGVDVATGTPDPWRMVASRHERGAADVVNDPARGPWDSNHNGTVYQGHFDAFEQIVPIGEQISWVHTFSDGVKRDVGFVLMELMEDVISRRRAAGEPTTAFPK